MVTQSPGGTEPARMISMKNYGADTYGERIADIYDERHPEAGAGQVELLAELAGAGPMLEIVGRGPRKR